MLLLSASTKCNISNSRIIKHFSLARVILVTFLFFNPLDRRALALKCRFLSGKPEYELMQTAWRERNPEARIKAAKDAIALNPECATAYILLAEEEASDITEAEIKFKEAYRIAETNHRRSQQLQHQVTNKNWNTALYQSCLFAECQKAFKSCSF